MIESNSSIGTFLTCPRLYQFKYIKLLKGRGYSSAMGVGIMLHAQVETFAGGRADALALEVARLKQECDAEFHAAIDHDHAFAQEFFTLWRQHWAGDHPFRNDAFLWVDAEAEWGFNLGEELRHVGKRDALVKHKENGGLYLYELKTATDRDRDGYIGRLEIDSQISSNILALRRSGLDVQGVLYDVAWKPAIRLKTGRKTMPDETMPEFYARMVETLKENPPEYFQRQVIYRNDNALKWHEEDLVSQMSAMETAAVTGKYYRNTKSCNDYGRLCQFFGLCVEGKKELEELYAKKTRKLPELSAEIQQDKEDKAQTTESCGT